MSKLNSNTFEDEEEESVSVNVIQKNVITSHSAIHDMQIQSAQDFDEPVENKVGTCNRSNYLLTAKTNFWVVIFSINLNEL